MDAKELRALSKQELNEKLSQLYKQLMDYQFKRKTGIEKPHLFGQTKREIARILTILKEKGNEKQ